MCRRSKVKCIHQGQSPCRNCLKSGRTEPGSCVLTGPFSSTQKPSDFQVQKPPRIVDRPTNSANASLSSPRCDDEQINTPRDQQSHEDVILRTPTSTIVQCASIFTRKFPELAFLHLSTFSGCWNRKDGVKHWVHIAAMLALCSRFLPPSTNGLLSNNYYKRCVEDQSVQ